MRILKLIIILTLTTSLIVVLNTGCSIKIPRSDESIRDEILDHLSVKYNKEFIAIALERGYKDLLLCYAEGTDPKADLVHAQRIVRDATKEYKDTYFGVIIKDEIESDIKSICLEIDLPMQVFYQSDVYYFDDYFDSTKNYADLKQWVQQGNRLGFDITIVLPMDDTNNSETYAQQIFTLLSDNNYEGLAFVCTLPSEIFQSATSVNLNDLLSEYRGKTTTFTKSIN